MDSIGLDKVRSVLAALPRAENVGKASDAAGGADFSAAFKQALLKVSGGQTAADELQQRFQLNDPAVSLEETMIATQAANISFQALVQVRNKLVSAYHDIMNMQV